MKDRLLSKQVTLAIHPGFEENIEKKKEEEVDNKEMAKAAGVDVEEIRALNSVIKKVYKSVKNLMTESKMSMIR